jgi:hypothetical protein
MSQTQPVRKVLETWGVFFHLVTGTRWLLLPRDEVFPDLVEARGFMLVDRAIFHGGAHVRMIQRRGLMHF